jgi:hypothetical protein
MFGSSILEVGIGLVICFLGVSIIASGITDYIGRFMDLRANSLLTGLKALLNDDGMKDLALAVYNHGGANPHGDGKATSAKNLSSKPSSMDPIQFANAMIDILGVAGKNLNDMQAAIDARVQDTQLNPMIKGMAVRANGDITKFRTEVSDWFDHGMDHLSRDYKRWSQWVSMAIALVMAAGLNIDSLYIGKTLWQQAHANTLSVTVDPKLAVDEKSGAALASLRLANLPIGWDAPNAAAIPAGSSCSVPANGSTCALLKSVFCLHGGWLLALIGWAITALATMFGAPFWYDALNRLVPLRGKSDDAAKKT